MKKLLDAVYRVAVVALLAVTVLVLIRISGTLAQITESTNRLAETSNGGRIDVRTMHR